MNGGVRFANLLSYSLATPRRVLQFPIKHLLFYCSLFIWLCCGFFGSGMFCFLSRVEWIIMGRFFSILAHITPYGLPSSGIIPISQWIKNLDRVVRVVIVSLSIIGGSKAWLLWVSMSERALV